MKERKNKILCYRGKIGFLELKNESHKAFNLNRKNKLKSNDNKLEEIQEKNRNYNVIKNYISNDNFIIMIIILFKFIIVITLFYKTKSNIFDYFFLENQK